MQSPVEEFAWCTTRPPVSGAGDVMYHRDVLNKIGPWNESNVNHEGTLDSETDMLQRVQKYLSENYVPLKCLMPKLPVAVAIYTDSRGTNARVRGNRRYGDYWPAHDGIHYYHTLEYSELKAQLQTNEIVPIEKLAHTNGFLSPVDENGNWKKNPIKIELATRADYVELVK